jgi:hypothetical protein
MLIQSAGAYAWAPRRYRAKANLFLVVFTLIVVSSQIIISGSCHRQFLKYTDDRTREFLDAHFINGSMTNSGHENITSVADV